MYIHSFFHQNEVLAILEKHLKQAANLENK